MCCTSVSWFGEMYDLDVSHLQFLYAYLVCIKCRMGRLLNQGITPFPLSNPVVIEYILLHSGRNLSRAKLTTSNNRQDVCRIWFSLYTPMETCQVCRQCRIPFVDRNFNASQTMHHRKRLLGI